jgi:hypothetical protein
MGDTKFRQTGRRTAAGPFRADEKQRRRAEGDIRNEVWRAMTTAEKIISLKGRRGESRRQMGMLEA